MRKREKGRIYMMIYICILAILAALRMTAEGKEAELKQTKASIEAAEVKTSQKVSIMMYEKQEQGASDTDVFLDYPKYWQPKEGVNFRFYEISDKYQSAGGYFPREVQLFTYELCKQYGVEYALVLALIEKESGYKYDSIGDGGKSIGYMQIFQENHTERMKRLGCDNLLNPYQNIKVGIDYLAELINKYGTMQDALSAYNYGETGAMECLWSKGIYMHEYNETIMSRMKEIKEEVKR